MNSPVEGSTRRPSRRVLAAFVVSLIALLLAGSAGSESPLTPSRNNHFTYQAAAWLDGRLALDDDPPGFCSAADRRARTCKQHTHDDWAAVWTLELRDGSKVRGLPCHTQACRAERGRGESFRLTDGQTRQFARGEIRARTRTWYVSFPPGPAALMTPAVLAFGLDAPDRLITMLLAAAAIALFLHMLDSRRGARAEHLWATAAVGLASPLFFLGAHGSVWFTAQVMATLGIIAYLHLGWDTKRPFWAGLALALAVSARPHVGLAFVFFAAAWWRDGRDPRTALRFAAPLVVMAVILGALNFARFDDPLEFGHRFLDIRWQTRIQETGLFALEYVPRNVRCALALLPVFSPVAPFFRVSVHGSAIWVGAPWIFALAGARERFDGRSALLASAGLIALVPLAYQNSGQIQTSYRFAAEWMPIALAAVVFGGGAERRWFAPLVVVGALFTLLTTVWFAFDPESLFVLEPMGWPFESELKP